MGRARELTPIALAEPTAARYAGLRPASEKASRAARGASRKHDTSCERRLRRALWSRGLRYRLGVSNLPGRPDIVFRRGRVVVFCDGDFWHGRNLDDRLARLARGHNAPYWVAKIRTNVARDARTNAALTADGWAVLRYWESEIKMRADEIAEGIAQLLASRRSEPSR